MMSEVPGFPAFRHTPPEACPEAGEFIRGARSRQARTPSASLFLGTGVIAMPWTRPNRWILCLLLLCSFSLGTASHIVVAHDYVSAPNLSETEQRVVTACLMLAAVIAGHARMEMVTRRKADDLAEGQQHISLQVEDSRQAASTAATKAEAAVEVVKKQLNGDLDARIQAAVRDQLTSVLPTAIEEACKKLRGEPPAT